MNSLHLVRLFHEKFGLPVRDTPKKPLRPERKQIARLIDEEARAAVEAVEAGASIGSVAAAVANLQYVCLNAALRYGYDVDAAFVEVHRSNMNKVWPDGMARFRPDGKVEKGPNWSPPDMVRAIGVE